MEKTKVLFVVLQLEAGGSERVVLDLSRCLSHDNFEVYVASFNSGVLAETLKDICRDVFIIEKKPGFDISAMLELVRIVRKYQIDVVNTHHYMPCFYSFLGTRLLNGRRLVYTEHSVPEVEAVASCFHRKIFDFMLYRINAVVGVSRAITDKFRENYPRHRQKFHVILNSVDIEKFRGRQAREEVRQSWGLARDHFVVGTVANFRTVKNHACLVRAAGLLKDSHPQLRLFFVGTGFPDDNENSENEVRQLIQDLGLKDRVILAGYQGNIPKILSALDAFCLPSFSEGLPVSLLEAMAAGVPVIGSNVKGIVEVVKHGSTGMLFPANSESELSNVLKKFLETPSFTTALAENAFSFVNDFHSLESWRKEYAKVLIIE